MKYFPMFMDIKGRRILICGGGKHAHSFSGFLFYNTDALAGYIFTMANVFDRKYILQTARIYSGVPGKVLSWRSAVGLHYKFNRCAV